MVFYTQQHTILSTLYTVTICLVVRESNATPNYIRFFIHNSLFPLPLPSPSTSDTETAVKTWSHTDTVPSTTTVAQHHTHTSRVRAAVIPATALAPSPSDSDVVSWVALATVQSNMFINKQTNSHFS